jgi:uncharacterized protein
MNRRLFGTAWPGLGLLFVVATGAHAESVRIMPTFGTNAAVPVQSIKALKYRGVIRQQYDFSCGSAAVATLLTYHYQRPVTEQEVFMEMYERGDRARIRREGFSLLDMKQYLDNRGFRSDGIFATLDDLERVAIPAIVLIDDKGYRHFVVIKGIRNGEVLVGDPAKGLRYYRKEDFQKLWTNGILFVARAHAAVARSHFNVEWAAIARAPLGSAVSRDTLANITLLRPPPGDF